MDASASPQVETDFSNVCGFFLKIENATFPTTLKQNNTVIKYTKLPDFDFDSRVSWPQNSYTLPPRLRRIISLDQDLHTSRSLQNDYKIPRKIMSSSYTKRKIVTISEDDEHDFHPRFSQSEKKSATTYSSNKGSVTSHVQDKEPSHRTISRLSSAKLSKMNKPTGKTSNANNSHDMSVTKSSHKAKYTNVSIQTAQINTKNRNNNTKEKETKINPHYRQSVNKNVNISNHKEIGGNVSTRNKVTENANYYTTPKKNTSQAKSHKSSEHKSKIMLFKEIKARSKPITTIHVPLDENNQKHNLEKEIKQILGPVIYDNYERIDQPDQIDCGIIADTINVKDVNVGTDPQPEKVDQFTDMEKINLNPMPKNRPTDKINNFDNLDVPNVTLTKEKDLSKDILACSQSLPNLQIPTMKITPHSAEKNCAKKHVYNSASYIIGQATLTCTTRQKINFHVVGNNETIPELPSNLLSYPMNVVSIFKKEIKKNEINDVTSVCNDTVPKENDPPNNENDSYVKENQLGCSYTIDNSKLVKPSDIISNLSINNDLLQNDFICEQFQRELDFIDSFIESLQYLESCSISNKCFKENKVGNWVDNSGLDLKTSEYNSLFSKLENGTDNDDTETMASKSLCLLNLLIRDEQRRAKNLLFVLKMREDALKDFTKSHILWLENKKRQDNTDISTLKKKQRGALLKLQHECGEMQRMRKALLALSEKRKLALMKTKKNIELKLKNNVNVNQIVLGKKKIKRIAADRNIAPLKCFELSSSGCDEINTSRPKSDSNLVVPDTPVFVKSAEKCIQTSDAALVDQGTDTAAENFIVVDGSYLNILFRNLSMPQIFSCGKEYEVNEEALKNIVNSTNSPSNLNECNVVEKFMDQIKNCDLDKSSTPSTARSLVEELDQYYKGLADEEKSFDTVERAFKNIVEREIDQVPLIEPKPNPIDQNYKTTTTISTMTSDCTDSSVHNATKVFTTDQSCMCENSLVTVETQSIKGEDSFTTSTQAGPLPVPVGAAAVVESTTVDALNLTEQSSLSSTTAESSISSPSLCPSVSSVSSLSSPVHCEAEELRRQQLAIEREIKALEQQQCQLLVVREIPDKPPPPYTPPTESRAHKPPRMFIVDEIVEEKIHRNIVDPTNANIDSTDAVDLFINEFCQETVEKHKSEHSDKPWDACNLLPQKASVDLEKLVKKATNELKEILSGVQPPAVSGVGSRRSDHIDDILFAEWRRCEPEWTALHNDEATVKNQIFESIFQKILTETVDEYKKIVPVEKNIMAE